MATQFLTFDSNLKKDSLSGSACELDDECTEFDGIYCRSVATVSTYVQPIVHFRDYFKPRKYASENMEKDLKPTFEAVSLNGLSAEPSIFFMPVEIEQMLEFSSFCESVGSVNEAAKRCKLPLLPTFSMDPLEEARLDDILDSCLDIFYSNEEKSMESSTSIDENCLDDMEVDIPHDLVEIIQIEKTTDMVEESYEMLKMSKQEENKINLEMPYILEPARMNYAKKHGFFDPNYRNLDFIFEKESCCGVIANRYLYVTTVIDDAIIISNENISGCFKDKYETKKMRISICPHKLDIYEEGRDVIFRSMKKVVYVDLDDFSFPRGIFYDEVQKRTMSPHYNICVMRKCEDLKLDINFPMTLSFIDVTNNVNVEIFPWLRTKKILSEINGRKYVSLAHLLEYLAGVDWLEDYMEYFNYESSDGSRGKFEVLNNYIDIKCVREDDIMFIDKMRADGFYKDVVLFSDPCVKIEPCYHISYNSGCGKCMYKFLFCKHLEMCNGETEDKEHLHVKKKVVRALCTGVLKTIELSDFFVREFNKHSVDYTVYYDIYRQYLYDCTLYLQSLSVSVPLNGLFQYGNRIPCLKTLVLNRLDKQTLELAKSKIPLGGYEHEDIYMRGVCIDIRRMLESCCD